MVSGPALGLLPPLAVVGGLRTPWAKAFGVLARVPALELGRLAVCGLLPRCGIAPANIDEVVFGNVAGPPEASNIARVIALSSGIPIDCVAHTVNRNCASGMESIIAAWQIIREGRARMVVAGGTESMSNVPLLWSDRFRRLWMKAGGEKHWWRKLATWSQLRPGMLKPVSALELGLTDGNCGLKMGETAESLAKRFSVSRDEQDRFALTSHQRAVAARERGFYRDEILHLTSAQTGSEPLDRDTGPRPKQTLEALAALKPVFEPRSGSVTVGNSCPITDGAAALLLMSPDGAKTLGVAPLGYLRAYAIAGCEPSHMGLGTVLAIRRLLQLTGQSLQSFDLYEINEAFAAQVLACMRAMASAAFARRHWQVDQPVGELEPDRLNVNGGAIALGHPVGATGTRLILTLLRALRERGLQNGLASLCVGGGQGAAVWVQSELEQSTKLGKGA